MGAGRYTDDARKALDGAGLSRRGFLASRAH